MLGGPPRPAIVNIVDNRIIFGPSYIPILPLLRYMMYPEGLGFGRLIKILQVVYWVFIEMGSHGGPTGSPFRV